MKPLLLLLLALPAVGQAQFTFNYATNNGTITITGYTGPPGNALVIPSTWEGLPITSIGNSAFDGCISLKTATISNNVSVIGASAFSGCSSLTNVSMGNNVTYIGSSAFAGCNLTRLSIGSGVTNIVGDPFNCASLWLITVNTNNSAYSSMFGWLFNKSQTKFIRCPPSNSSQDPIPSSVTSIADFAFQGCVNQTSIQIPNGVTNIGNWTFWNCANLTSVTIPNSVANIGGHVFRQCPKLNSVIIDNGIGSIGDNAFLYCTSLTNIVIPYSVTNIGSQAFTACTNLTKIYFIGNAPHASSFVFFGDNKATIYYLPGTTNWTNPWQGCPAVCWNPQAQTSGVNFGIQTNQFGFTITGSSNLVVVVETCTNFSNPVWLPVSTNTLNTFAGTNGTYYFSDPQWTNASRRFYRFRSP